MIVLPPGGGYWLDGHDHDCPFDTRGNPILPNSTWRAKFETDDTAKCYRRFFVGRVSGAPVGATRVSNSRLTPATKKNACNETLRRVRETIVALEE
jgi:RAP1 GTPase activating protein 1